MRQLPPLVQVLTWKTTLTNYYSVDIYPCKTNADLASKHFFVKFKDNKALHRVLNIITPGIRVSSVSGNLKLIQQCREAINSTPLNSRPFDQKSPMLIEFPSHEKRKKVRPRRMNISRTPIDTVERTPPVEIQNLGSFFQASKSSKDAPEFLMYPTNEKKLPFINAPNITITPPKCSSRSPKAPGSSDRKDSSASPAPTENSASSYLQNTILNLSFWGESITFDLKALEQDSRSIIELLKATAGERGSWMMVGAYYRRSGNVYAAISVIEAMIDGRDFMCFRKV